jgi:hypothetical protein
MVHAVIESGGIAILQQAGVTSALVNKIKVVTLPNRRASATRSHHSQVNMKTPLLPMVLALLCLMVHPPLQPAKRSILKPLFSLKFAKATPCSLIWGSCPWRQRCWATPPAPTPSLSTRREL